MKKTVTILALFVLALNYSSVRGQSMTAGGGLVFGTDISQLGFTLNGQYFINDALAISPSFIFYLPDKTEVSFFGFSSSTTSSLWEFNADVNYYFLDSSVRLYGIGGLNLSFWSFKSEGTNFPTTKVTDTNVGLNLGIGSDFKTSGAIIPFAALKFTVSDYQQLVIMGGVRFPF